MSQPYKGRTALIVEDEPLLARELTLGLQELGCAVVASRTSAVARSLLGDSPAHIDLAVLDLAGGRDCLPLARTLLRQGAIVLLTSAVAQHMPTLAGGIALPVLEKPYTFGEVLNAFAAVAGARA